MLAIFRYDDSAHLNSHYLDGVSITHGKQPRSHIWSFASSWGSIIDNGCPCSGDSYRGSVPSFVGRNYFCETGHRNNWQGNLYPDNPLWDGIGCLDTSTCCDPPEQNLPWFCTTLSSASANDIEVRLCGNQATSDEDVPIEQVENMLIYIIVRHCFGGVYGI